MKYALVVMTLAMTTIAYAHGHDENAEQIPGCENIAKQCVGAGFHVGDHKKDGKGLWVDCVGAIAKGQKITNVTATQDEAKKCAEAGKAKREAHKAAKKS